MKVSEFNTLYYGKCIKIWADEQYQRAQTPFGVDVGLTNLNGANDTLKVFFTTDKTVSNLIVGLHPGIIGIPVYPLTYPYFQLRYAKRDMMF